MSIIVYNGPGASEFCVREVLRTLTGLGWWKSIDTISDPQSLITALSRFEKGLLIMPGGRDKPYQESFTGDGVKTIRDFVQRGGTYIGICAGAYFACENIEFEVSI